MVQESSISSRLQLGLNLLARAAAHFFSEKPLMGSRCLRSTIREFAWDGLIKAFKRPTPMSWSYAIELEFTE